MKKPSKSKTLHAAAFVAALGAVELNMHVLRDNLGDWYGVTYIFIAVVIAYLRFITTESISNDD